MTLLIKGLKLKTYSLLNLNSWFYKNRKNNKNNRNFGFNLEILIVWH